MRNPIKKYLHKTIVCLALALPLAACNGFFEKDNTPAPTPLSNFTPEIRPYKLWTAHTGAGSGDEYLKMTPAIDANTIVTTGLKGTVTAVNKINGRVRWEINTGVSIVAGPGLGDGIVAIGTNRGVIVALQENNGREIWRRNIPGEILAQPAVGHGMVIVKAVDGYLRALSVTDGHELWSYRQTEPALILRSASAPQIHQNSVITGFANGNFTKLGLNDGQLLWQQTITLPSGAFAVQRMIDIDADPVVFEHRIYVATYQGKIAALDWTSGRLLWNHDISSYTGMTADENGVYISDAKSHVWGFNADSGLVSWRQTRLESRMVTGPASIGNYVVVGDAQGYLHWLSKQDGHFAARDYVGAPIYASPIAENNVLYALSNNGYLSAYRLK